MKITFKNYFTFKVKVVLLLTKICYNFITSAILKFAMSLGSEKTLQLLFSNFKEIMVCNNYLLCASANRIAIFL